MKGHSVDLLEHLSQMQQKPFAKGLMHKNKAARKKSQLAKKLNSAE